MPNKIKAALRPLLYEASALFALKHGDNKRFMNLGYKGAELELKPEDRQEQLNFQLYNVISSSVDLKGKNVLEIGCGRGGGCYFLKEYKKAGKVTGIDLSASNIKIAHKLVGSEQVVFYRQSAENPDLPINSFDGIVNLESSHCYSSKKVFFDHVFSLLKPGGVFIYADNFIPVNIPKIKRYLNTLGFTIEREQDITRGVIESLNERPVKKVSFVKKHIIPIFLGSFYGYEQSEGYRQMKNGQKKYFSFVCIKREDVAAT